MTRQGILDAALLAFAERGWEKTTFELVAARAGVSRGAVHHHFRAGKDELLRTLLAEQWQRYAEPVFAPLEVVGRTPAARLRDFLAGYLDLLVDDEAFRALATVTVLVAPRTDGLDEGLADHRRALGEWRGALDGVFSGAGVLRPGVDRSTAVAVVMNVLVGLTTTAAMEPDELPRDGSARQAMAAAVTAGLVGEDR